MSVLNEITARKGPRTGAFEFDINKVRNIVQRIFLELKDKRSEGIPYKNWEGVFTINSPITDEKQSIKIGGLISQQEGGAFYPSSKNIILFISNKDWHNFCRSVDRNEEYKTYTRILQHELNHYFDKSIADNTGYKQPESNEEYINELQEVRAYIQETYSVVKNKIPYVNQYLHFPSFVKDMTDRDGRFDLMNIKNKKRVYKALHDMWANLVLPIIKTRGRDASNRRLDQEQNRYIESQSDY